MKFIGTARNVMELVKVLENVHGSALLESKGLDESFSYVEVWYDYTIDTVIIK
jgi:hypothetical protein